MNGARSSTPCERDCGFGVIVATAFAMGTGAVSEIRIRAHDLTADSAPPKELAAPKLSDVVGAIGHDLRTPLAVVSMAQDYLSAHLPAATPELEEMLELIRRGVDNCLLKVEALIDFARDEPLARDCVTPDALIEEAASAVGAAFALRIETAIEANLPPLLVDRYLFRRALIHLMRNAAEAAPTGEAAGCASAPRAKRASLWSRSATTAQVWALSSSLGSSIRTTRPNHKAPAWVWRLFATSSNSMAPSCACAALLAAAASSRSACR